MTSTEVRKRFLAFFESRGHAIIQSSPLVPENDPTVLFNTAGMQPLVPYLMGRPHPQGNKLANFQKCLRTGDIDDIGDNTHLTFFEMMGNWSLGSYFKKEAIEWSYELLTSKTEGFGLDPNRLYVTVFAGDTENNIPRDDEASEIWQSVGVPAHRIYFKGADANWWPAVKNKSNDGEKSKDTWTGPTGPCSEMFYDLTPNGLGDMTPEEYEKADEAQHIVEIWNDVFMEYEKKDGKIVSKLASKNVDTGSGFERMCTVLQGKTNVFETDIFVPLMDIAKTLASDIRRQRIISDHIRAATFLISDGVIPANTDQGYVLRRLIRRMVFNTDAKKIDTGDIQKLVSVISEMFASSYPNVLQQKDFIVYEITKEIEKFAKTLDQGVKEFDKLSKNATLSGTMDGTISGLDAFTLFSSFGFPIDMTIELTKERGFSVDRKAFDIEFKKHQELSRKGAEQKFKGGLGDTSEMSLKYHTATHLLHEALREVLGTHVSQKGSNITPERLRLDFTHTGKMTDEEKKKVEEKVNEWIAKKLPVHHKEMPKDEAEKTDALHFFGDKYGDIVSVYYIGENIDSAISKEFCGGPHVENTEVLGTFKIQKEEAVSAGVRRIKAILS